MPTDPSLEKVAAALAGATALLPPGRTELAALPADVACVVATTGSSGRPKLVALGAAALTASAAATYERLGGPGQWLACLPADHVAGLQVLVRSVLAGTSPVRLPPGQRFTSEAFARAAAGMSGPRRYVSLVPTQLHRLLAGPPEAIAALAGFDAVLVGGAALDPALAARARATEVRLVTTYGASETAGGCVYDGVPLAGVSVHVAASGRIVVSGATLALGYLADDGALLPEPTKAPGEVPLDAREGFAGRGAHRAFVTPDLGHWLACARLAVDGRADDVIVTGGLNVHPAAIEDAIRLLPQVRDVVVVGLPDPHWGQRVVAVVEPEPATPPPTLAQLAAATAALAPRHARPKALVLVDHLPRQGIGKPDRQAAKAQAQPPAQSPTPPP